MNWWTVNSYLSRPTRLFRLVPSQMIHASRGRPYGRPSLMDRMIAGYHRLPEARSPEKANDSAVKSIVRRGLFPLGAGLPAAVDPPVLAGIDADDVFDRSGVTLGDVAQRVVL
jgi:hypothetical protein